ncbi:hypothetical protein ZOSMA_76G00690 [Zostera marina]|uniref:Transmembrane protein n=1 Tax=Zostera marina TaxID=29655 RepID=A0A0K9NPG5_ZOSMR|nr:hypothetical protein ZOSMA_76G00690 [Zostera marina]
MDHIPFPAEDGGGVCHDVVPGRNGRRKGDFGMLLIRFGFTAFFFLTMSCLLSFLFGIMVVLFGGFFFNSTAVSLPSQCKILSSGVDLRSSKVCGHGTIDYKVNNVFYSLDKKRVRCRDDYYWTSVFKVEYKDYFSGRLLHAIAETPREALPLDCRPSFGAAWSAKSEFKVNETYKCKYIPGIQRADIDHDDLFNCQSKEPSNVEIIKLLFTLLLDKIFDDKRNGDRTMLAAVTGIITGVLVSVCFINILKLLDASRRSLSKKWNAGKFVISIVAFHFRRACVVVVYFSLMGWLTLQYSKAIGLKQLFNTNHLGEEAR